MADLAGQEVLDEMPAHLRIDAEVVGRYLEQRLPGRHFSGLAISKFSTGQSNPTYRLTLQSGERMVLRKQPPGELAPSAHRIDREFKVYEALSRLGVPVPRPICYCADKSVLGAEFFVVSFVSGAIYGNGLDDCAESARRPILMEMIAVLAQVHAVDIQASGLAAVFGRKGNAFYERQLKSLDRVHKIQVARGTGVKALARSGALTNWFAQNLPPERVGLVHGDYKPDNIIMDSESNRVLAVLDWELSTIGNPLSDLANILLPYFVPRGAPDVLFQPMPPGAPTADSLIQHYCKLTSTPYPIPNFEFYTAFAFYRLAVILHGVASRISSNQASGNAFSAQGAEMLANVCVDYALRTVGLNFNELSQ